MNRVYFDRNHFFGAKLDWVASESLKLAQEQQQQQQKKAISCGGIVTTKKHK